MSKRKYLVVAAACLSIAAMLWLLLPAAVPKTDAARFERWKRTNHLIGRAFWWEIHLPKSVSTALRLPALDGKYWGEHEKLGEALVSSGYLTNVAITVSSAVTNAAQYTQIRIRVQKAFQGQTDAELKYWYDRGHRIVIVVTCRPQDEVLCRQALSGE